MVFLEARLANDRGVAVVGLVLNLQFTAADIVHGAHKRDEPRDERHHWCVAAIADIVPSSGVGLAVDAVAWLGRWRGCHHHGRSGRRVTVVVFAGMFPIRVVGISGAPVPIIPAVYGGGSGILRGVILE